MYWYEEDVRELERGRAARGQVADAAAFYGSPTFGMWKDPARDVRALNPAFGGSTPAACAYFFAVVIYAGITIWGTGGVQSRLSSFRALAGMLRSRSATTPV
jgi:hypothetical protein